MTKLNFKSILALALTVMMVLSIVPMAVFADEAVATKITSMDQLVSGQYVVVSTNNKAMTTFEKDWYLAVDVAPVDGKITSVSSATVITVTVTDGKITMKDSAGKFIGKGDSNKMANAETVWVPTCDANGAFTILVDGDADGRMLCYAAASNSLRFRQYRPASIEAAPQNYVTTFNFYKVEGTVTPDAPSTPETPDTPDTPAVKPTTPEEIVKAAYALEAGATLDGTYTLTGVITSIDTAYSEQYGNVSVVIQVGNMADKPILCYRMKGNGADTIKSGDTITVTGTLTNYNGTIEFKANCSLDKVVPAAGEVVIYDTPKAILDAAYALEIGKTLSDSHVYTLTGVITSVDTEYSEQYKNVTVTMVVDGMTDKPIQCYRLKGEGADVIKVGDTITVSGSIIKYNDKSETGKVEFNSGCVIDSYSSVNPPKTGDALIVLVPAMMLAGVAILCVVSRKRRFN